MKSPNIPNFIFKVIPHNTSKGLTNVDQQEDDITKDYCLTGPLLYHFFCSFCD
jgi:hypothetical protein